MLMRNSVQPPNACAFWLWAFAGTFAFGALSYADDAEPSAGPTAADSRPLTDATEALAKWTRALITLQMRYERVPLPHDAPDWDGPRASPPVQEWVRTDAGQEYRVERASNYRRLVVCDGVRRYEAGHHLLPGDSSLTKPDEVRIRAPGGDPLVIGPLYGLWFNQRNEWLGELLERNLAEFVAVENIEDAACVRLELKQMPNQFLTVWLDPDHGYLPRRAVTGPAATGAFHNNVAEFRKLDIGMWFPWSGEFWHPVGREPARHTYRWRMHEVRVGEPIAPSRFAPPPIPEGTHVLDELTGRSYMQGGVRERAAAEAEIAQKAHQNLKRTASSPLGSRPLQRLSWAAIIGVSLLAVLAGLYRAARRKRLPPFET
jgi:hypothetical protein